MSEEATYKTLRTEAERGDPRAQQSVALMLDFGNGAPKDPMEATKWFRLAAEQGLPQYHLGLKYDFGEGVEQDRIEAAKWYSLAAEQGHEEARYCLAVFHRFWGNNAIDSFDDVKRIRLKGALGDEKSQFHLGIMYYFGEVTPKDQREAAKWFAMASVSGHYRVTLMAVAHRERYGPGHLVHGRYLLG